MTFVNPEAKRYSICARLRLPFRMVNNCIANGMAKVAAILICAFIDSAMIVYSLRDVNYYMVDCWLVITILCSKASLKWNPKEVWSNNNNNKKQKLAHHWIKLKIDSSNGLVYSSHLIFDKSVLRRLVYLYIWYETLFTLFRGYYNYSLNLSELMSNRTD